uniref:Conserved oligomeric Golgi complex subunit 5 n=1 Tax=Haemonchus contortus TaxID=6289 RepID=A0A7I4XY91_HAECO
MSVETDLEDFIWGRITEQNYLERIVTCDEFTSENILRRVSQIDESLNRQLRKGVEENLSRLLEQTTALEALDCTQRNVHSEMNEVYENCDRFAKTLDSLLHDYRNLVAKLEGLTVEKDLTADALRCEDLLDSLEKRNEIVKRSEIVSEIKGVVADNSDLLSISWLRDALTTRLKAVENEVRRSAADDLRRGLVSLNASLISSATRALENLEVLDAELEVQLSSAAAEVDSKLVELSSSPESSMRSLQQCVNLIHSQLEQCALLGKTHLMRFVEKLARIIRARVPLDATYSLRFIQQINRVLSARPECSGPLIEALRPLKNSISSQSLARLHRIVEQQDFNTSQNLVFVDVLSSAIEEKIKRLSWDNELRDETEKNIQKCLSMVAKRLESELKLDTENLLLGDRLRSDQLKNYRLLEVANGLAAKWPSQATPLLTFEQEAVAIIMESIRESIFTIVGAMHREVLGNKDISPYMQELIAYINRIEFHTSHFPSSIRRSASLSFLADYIIELFLINATLLRPSSDSIRQRLRTDLESLLDAVESKLNPSMKYPDRNQLLSLWHRDGSIFDNESDTSLPTWIYLHILISDSPNNLVSPHTSVDWTIDQYVKWCCDHTDFEIVSFLSGLLASYTTTVVNRHETQFVPHYPKMMELVRKATDSTT